MHAQPVDSTQAARWLAEQAHAGQVDDIGRPIIDHLHAVATQVRCYHDNELVMAAWLHELPRHTEYNIATLRELGVPPRVISIVATLVQPLGEPDTRYMVRVRGDHDATRILLEHARDHGNPQSQGDPREHAAAIDRAAPGATSWLDARDDAPTRPARTTISAPDGTRHPGKYRIRAAWRQALASELKDRYLNGESIRALAASIGRSYGYVYRILAEAGVDMRARGGPRRRRREP